MHYIAFLLNFLLIKESLSSSTVFNIDNKKCFLSSRST